MAATPYDDLPLVDGHAHPVLLPSAVSSAPFARYFTEAHDDATIREHAPSSLFYRHALGELAGLLACEPTECAVVEARAAQPFEAYLRQLLGEARVKTILVDDGYPR
ncbi:MAG: amidohydrolase, partial [Chloroflexi bacterium]|nr:amidohydrolase [Chloroflexota bacterium]